MLEKSTTRPIWGYCNENKRTNNYLQNLYVGIAMDVKKTNNYLWDLYANIIMDVKKLATIYKTYMWVLHIWNGLMEIIIEKM
jgi:hypothetical protein